MRKFLIACLLLVAVARDASSAAVPSEAQLKTLTRDSLLSFNKAVQARDFTAFHGEISALWRKQITPAKLKSIFAPFIKQKIDLSPIADVEPVFDQPAAIDGDGVLIVQGRYPTRMGTAQFRLKYVEEKSAWKLLGIKVDVKPAGAPGGKVPIAQEARAIVRESLLIFNEAVLAGDFSSFHQRIATVWQEQITPAQLRDALAGFVEQKVNIGPVADLEPVFNPEPEMDDDGVLLLKGHYPTRPNKVHFKLRYIHEGGAWRLVNIGVNVSPSDDPENEE